MSLTLNDFKGIAFPAKSTITQVFILCLISSLFFINTHANAEDKASYFKENKEEIMAALQKDYDDDKLQAVIDAASQYAGVEDEDLKKLVAKSQQFIDIRKITAVLMKLPENGEEKKKTELYQKLADLIPDSEIGKKMGIYKRLSRLNPENKEYHEKFLSFEKIAKEKEQKLLAEIEEASKILGNPIEKYAAMSQKYADLSALFPEKSEYKEKENEVDAIALGFLTSGLTEWYVTQEESNVYIRLDSSDTLANDSRPLLVLRCQEDTTAMFILWKTFIQVVKAPMKYRVDSKKAKTKMFRVAGDHKTVGYFSGKKSIPFIKSLFGGSKLTVEVTPYGESTETVTFNIKDVETVIKPLRTACHW